MALHVSTLPARWMRNQILPAARDSFCHARPIQPVPVPPPSSIRIPGLGLRGRRGALSTTSWVPRDKRELSSCQSEGQSTMVSFQRGPAVLLPAPGTSFVRGSFKKLLRLPLASYALLKSSSPARRGQVRTRRHHDRANSHGRGDRLPAPQCRLPSEAREETQIGHMALACGEAWGAYPTHPFWDPDSIALMLCFYRGQMLHTIWMERVVSVVSDDGGFKFIPDLDLGDAHPT
ncbi:hypothetical protein LZ31DRAFT_183749 [Colletotrichum somersetense]|nr:hypothetical protein LZ31DRAFT_183749 [Colletotrichum somersetense]